jgi:hypothetical protein
MGLASVRTRVLSFGSREISDFLRKAIVYAVSTAGFSPRSDLVPEALRSMTDPTLPPGVVDDVRCACLSLLDQLYFKPHPDLTGLSPTSLF